MIKPTGQYGYTEKDIKKLCKEKSIPINLFWKAFSVNTVAIDDNGDNNYYSCDVETALYKLGDKDGRDHLWD